MGHPVWYGKGRVLSGIATAHTCVWRRSGRDILFMRELREFTFGESALPERDRYTRASCPRVESGPYPRVHFLLCLGSALDTFEWPEGRTTR